MNFTSRTGSPTSAKTDMLVLLHLEGERCEPPKAFDGAHKAAKAAGDLPGEFRKHCLLYPAGRASQKRVLLLCAGSGKKLDAERVRRLVAHAGRLAEQCKAGDYVVVPSKGVLDAVDAGALGVAAGEGAVLGAYRYEHPTGDKRKPLAVKKGALMAPTGKVAKALADGVKAGAGRARSVCFARDLGNKGGNLLTPSILAREARKLAGPGIKVTILDEARMARLGMHALLGVSKGSAEPARLIVLDYNPKGAKQTLCVVGKGLTFDAGGISLKPSAAMDEMRYDMCGSAAVMGLFHALASGAARSRCRVVGVIGSSENLPDGKAQKPGDIVTAMNGKTIEVLNTDAEGRLVLADALCYAVKNYDPDAIVDLATLTGAVIIALGHEVAAAVGNDDGLVAEVMAAGERAGDRLWQLPLWDVHRQQMKGRYADLRNINSGKADGNGTIAGAAFLEYFVDGRPWVHLDIAGTAWGAKAKDYYQSGATGFGVRALVEWVGAR
ncbi:MAG: leucyl aminopeptidase [Planctomycetota bacterium]